MAEAVLLSPRALTIPELCRRVLDAYEQRLDSGQTARVVALNPTQVLARLNQIGVRMRPGGKSSTRRPGFEEDNPPERLAAIRDRLEAARLRRLFLVEEGRFTEADLAMREKQISSRPFMGTPSCSAADYQTTLATSLRVPELWAVANELDISPGQLFSRFQDMSVDRRSLGDPADQRMARHVAALQSYLELVVMIEGGQPA